jgi:NAD(P)H-dependent FMN reductase
VNQNPLHVAVILGSNREGRFCDTVANWVIDELKRHPDIAVDTIDSAVVKLPCRLKKHDDATVIAYRRRIGRADAFLIVTPEYNHGYTSALKFLIDLATTEWQAKPVGFISYGGTSGGLRAVEQLRQVFAELHAVSIRDGVSFANARDRFDARGRLLDPEGAARSFTSMLTTLKWWATALRQRREIAPYEDRAAA